jgi:hypothetical protein
MFAANVVAFSRLKLPRIACRFRRTFAKATANVEETFFTRSKGARCYRAAATAARILKPRRRPKPGPLAGNASKNSSSQGVFSRSPTWPYIPRQFTRVKASINKATLEKLSMVMSREWLINAQLSHHGVGARKRNLFLHASNPVFAVEPFTLAAL